MSRVYFDTPVKVYHLLSEHPIMNKLLTEFDVEDDNIKDVSNYLFENNDTIASTPLTNLYYYSDVVDTIGELYGFTPPFDNQVSSEGTPLFELLNFTLYLYKFGTTDNFYEKHLLDFLPEYDREQILNEPKLKLLYESIGRKLDDIELKVSEMKNIYDIDDVPDHILDYLGQNIGYEKEDYTLKNISFRELLKNIIEIYKIKGTNYSFSFFFKFLGFEISLKEFFFNRDVKNPEGFPGMEHNKVEYYLTTKNPLFDVSNNKPAKYLEKTKNINDWDLELKSLQEAGCTNPIEYMLGFEPYNNKLDNPIWHNNPWTYFKTNLIEYELNPFFDKLNLTANDNETIKKYIKFLSPTYLFTWINVNLKPWIEDINIIQDDDEGWSISMVKDLGDPRPTPEPWPFNKKTSDDFGFNGFNNDGIYYDYEPLDEILEIYKGGEKLTFFLENNMNLGDHEHIGTTLKRDGVYIRQPGHPKYISNISHEGDKKISFDFMNIEVMDFIDTYTTINYYTELPTNPNDGDVYYVRFSDEEYEYGYYRYNNVINEWRKLEWNDYSYRSYPAAPIDPTPDNNQTLSESNILEFTWEKIDGAIGYWLQLATDNKFNNIIIDVSFLHDNYYNTLLATQINHTLDVNGQPFVLFNYENLGLTYLPHQALFSNNKYYWRIKTKNSATFPNLPDDNDFVIDNAIWSPWSNHWQFTLKTLPFPFNGEVINTKTIFNTINYDQINQFQDIEFDISWDTIPGSEYYRIQVLFNKPYTWKEDNNLLFIDTFNNLPLNKELGTYIYVVDEQKFYILESVQQGWVSISEPENYSVVDTYDELPTYEQKFVDCWYVIDENNYYSWQSIQNEWHPSTEMFNVIGNIANIDQLMNTDSTLGSLYFVLASNEFYKYIPIEETSQSIRTIYDEIVNDNLLHVKLENGLYYWRIKNYHKELGWQDWGPLYNFTIDFT